MAFLLVAILPELKIPKPKSLVEVRLIEDKFRAKKAPALVLTM